jgi:hypothetical protein
MQLKQLKENAIRSLDEIGGKRLESELNELTTIKQVLRVRSLILTNMSFRDPKIDDSKNISNILKYINHIYFKLKKRETVDRPVRPRINVNDVTIKKHIAGSNMHMFEVDCGISRIHAIALQTELGYNPEGYGFHSFEATVGKTIWRCFASCD